MIIISSKYCSNCGTKLQSDSRFCINCGLKTEETPLTKTTPLRDEPILLSVPVGFKEGIFIEKQYAMVITQKRIILAIITSKMVSEESKKASEEAKNQGKGMFARMAVSMSVGYTLSDKYYNMYVEDILSENRENFYINNGEIIKIEFKKSHTTYDMDDNPREEAAKIIIKTGSKKIKLSLLNSSLEKTLYSKLQEIFIGRIK